MQLQLQLQGRQSLNSEMILIVSPQSSQSVSEGRLNFPGCQAVILAQEVLSRDYIAKTIIWINWLLAASSCFLIITVVRGEREVSPRSVLFLYNWCRGLQSHCSPV